MAWNSPRAILGDDFAVDGEETGEDLLPRVLRGDAEMQVGGVSRCSRGLRPRPSRSPINLAPQPPAGITDSGYSNGGTRRFFDGCRQRGDAVFTRPERLISMHDAIHVAAADADDRRAASLRLERHKPEGLLHAGMDEEIGGAIERGEAVRIGAIGQMSDWRLVIGDERFEVAALQAIADDEQMKPPRKLPTSAQTPRTACAYFFLRQPPDVKQQRAPAESPNSAARGKSDLARRAHRRLNTER